MSANHNAVFIPRRYCPGFGAAVYDPTRERDSVPVAETVAALGELIAAGKIRHYGRVKAANP
jgi:hypothetical protein